MPTHAFHAFKGELSAEGMDSAFECGFTGSEGHFDHSCRLCQQGMTMPNAFLKLNCVPKSAD